MGNARAIWRFLKPQVHVYSKKPRFTSLGVQWRQVDRAGTVRRTKSKEDTRRIRLLRKFLKRYNIAYQPFHRVEERIERDRYRLVGWSLRRPVKAAQTRPSVYFQSGPWVNRVESDAHEAALWKCGHPRSQRQPAARPDQVRDPELRAAYEADIWDCIDQEFHVAYCTCESCMPAVAVGQSESAPVRVRQRRSVKKT